MKHRYGRVTLAFLEQTIEIDATVQRTVDDVTWENSGSFRTSVPRTMNPDDVTGVLWDRLQALGDFDARQTFIDSTVQSWVASTVYNA